VHRTFAFTDKRAALDVGDSSSLTYNLASHLEDVRQTEPKPGLWTLWLSKIFD